MRSSAARSGPRSFRLQSEPWRSPWRRSRSPGHGPSPAGPLAHPWWLWLGGLIGATYVIATIVPLRVLGALLIVAGVVLIRR
ncbi:MAG: DMT family transporter [Vulcanimicrobiaceae bacterium]